MSRTKEFQNPDLYNYPQRTDKRKSHACMVFFHTHTHAEDPPAIPSSWEVSTTKDLCGCKACIITVLAGRLHD